MVKHYKYIIIGSSAAALSALNKLWQLDPDGSAVCITAQKEAPYNKCLLADYAIGGKTQDEISLKIAHQRVEFRYDTTVTKIDRAQKIINLSDNSSILFQQLLLATGARPYRPLIEGVQLPHVISFHSLADVQSLLARIKQDKISNAVVIGAGLTGLECADVLRSYGVATTIIERNTHVLASQLCSAGAALIEGAIKEAGTRLCTDATAARITDTQVELSNGEIIPAQLVVLALGVQPNSELAIQAELALYNRHVVVNDFMQSSDPAIYAAGDLVAVRDQLTGQQLPSCTWPDAMHQGMIAAHNMAGQPKQYPGALTITSSGFFGLKFASTGIYKELTNDFDEDFSIIDKHNKEEFLRIILKKGIPVGFQQVGARLSSVSELRRAMLTKQTLTI